jgi:hypothetical protein
MADKKITALTALTGANTVSTDVFPIVDVSATETKKITAEELAVALAGQGIATQAYADSAASAAVAASTVDFADVDNILANAVFL